MAKILIAASTFSHIRNFHLPYLKWFQEQGWTVHVMGSGDASAVPWNGKVIALPFRKSLFSPGNWLLALRAARLFRRERYDVILVHTSLAAFFLRLGVWLSFCRPRLLVNTVHGYLFDDDTPAARRLLLLAAEKIMKPVTDLVLVMNRADYEIAQKHSLYKKKLVAINGMGVELSRFSPPAPGEQEALRRELGIPQDSFSLVYAAEFSQRKNQAFLVRAMRELRDACPDIHLFLLGEGAKLEEVRALTRELDVEDCVSFPGYAQDTSHWYRACDLCVSASRSEGLPFNLMEAFSCGLPVVASSVKGHTDLVENGVNGYLYEYNAAAGFCDAVRQLYADSVLALQMGRAGRQSVQKYDISQVLPAVTSLLQAEWESFRSNE